MIITSLQRTRCTVAIAAVVFLSAASAHAKGTWTPLPNMQTGGALPMLAELKDGRVAVIGGIAGECDEMEIFDPSTRTWSNGARLPIGMSFTTPLRLPDGRVLVANGGGCGGPIGLAEIYDPTSDSWSLFGLPFGGYYPGVAPLADGRVLIAGGDTLFTVYNQTTIFDPATNTSSPGPSMTTPRAAFNLVPLADGRVLAYGGYQRPAGGGGVVENASAEIYDPVTNSWSAAASSAAPRSQALGARLQDGRVLVAGGISAVSSSVSASATAEIYDPAANTWSAAPSMTAARSQPLGGVMFDGRVIVVSADPVTGVRTAEQYVTGSAAWTPIETPTTSGSQAGAVVFNSGQELLLAGGADGTASMVTAELYKLNHRPTAVLTIANPNTQSVPGSMAAVFVSAAGSSDADGDRLSYVWSEGGTVLATSSDPTRSATIGLAIGTHTLTLTVTDTFNESGTATATVSVTDGSTPPVCRPDDDDQGHDHDHDSDHDHDRDDRHDPKPKQEPKPKKK